MLQGGKTLLNGVPPEQLGVAKWRTQVQLPREQHLYERWPAVHSDYSAVVAEAAARCLSCMLACETGSAARATLVTPSSLLAGHLRPPGARAAQGHAIRVLLCGSGVAALARTASQD